MSLLQVRGLQVSYGGINAVKGIDLQVHAGEMVAVIGANGAGKSTTLKAISGLLAHGGQVLFQGQDVSSAASHELVTRGVSMVPEGRGVFGRLTVEENLEMGAYLRRDRQAVRAQLGRVYAMFPRLQERRRQTAGTLSGGEQQMLAIGRALMSQPKLLLLDEPSMGLAPMMVERIFETVRSISREGVTVLLVEQNAKLALESSHRGYVMESGRIVLAAASSELLNNREVRKAYLGE
jgi:branched-chain amino acid transport system ATP-binding protein